MVCVKWGNDCDLNSISTQLEKIVSFSHAKKKNKRKNQKWHLCFAACVISHSRLC